MYTATYNRIQHSVIPDSPGAPRCRAGACPAAGAARRAGSLYVRMYVCMYVCMYVSMYVCTYVRTYVYIYIYIYVYIYIINLDVFTIHYIHICIYTYTYIGTKRERERDVVVVGGDVT